MILLVCGDRHWEDKDLLFEVLDLLDRADDPIDLLIEGEARGADTLAAYWARTRGVTIRPFLAQWTVYGRRAGPLRNLQMLNEGQPERVVGFHDHILSSTGTVHMLNLAAAVLLPCKLFSHAHPEGLDWPLRS